jgi:hypothetical protein
MTLPTDNVGVVPLKRGGGKWAMTQTEIPPTGAEYEDFLLELEGFIAGYFFSKGVYTLPVYCQGDFFGERTEAIHFTEPDQVPKQIFSDFARWLAVPKREKWRIIFPTAEDTVVYRSQVLYPKKNP